MTLTAADQASPSSGEAGTPGPRAGQRARRTFSNAYKMRIVAEYDGLSEHGARGALLRREGLYQSHVGKWRHLQEKRRRSPQLPGTAAVSSVATDAQVRRLKMENEKLAAELTRTKAVMEVLGKAHALLEILSESTESQERESR